MDDLERGALLGESAEHLVCHKWAKGSQPHSVCTASVFTAAKIVESPHVWMVISCVGRVAEHRT